MRRASRSCWELPRCMCRMPGPRSQRPAVLARPSPTAEGHDTVFSYCASLRASSHSAPPGLPGRFGPFCGWTPAGVAAHTPRNPGRGLRRPAPEPAPEPPSARPGEAPFRGGLTCSRWLLTRCMLSAGLLGRILPQPRTVHRMLVRTARDSSLTDGWISSRAGGSGPAGCCLAAAGRGRLPLSRPGGSPRARGGGGGSPRGRRDGRGARGQRRGSRRRRLRGRHGSHTAEGPKEQAPPPASATSGRGRGLQVH